MSSEASRDLARERDAPAAEPASRTAFTALLALTAAGAILRLPGLRGKGYWLVEDRHRPRRR